MYVSLLPRSSAVSEATWTLSIRASSKALVLESARSLILLRLDWSSWWSACAAREDANMKWSGGGEVEGMEMLDRVGEVEVESVALGLRQGVGEKAV